MDEVLTLFIDDIRMKIENKSLSREEKFLLLEFYINSKYTEAEENASDNTLLKYLAMGWYIYSQLERERDSVTNEQSPDK